MANSLPKAGSHLLERALCAHPRIYRAPVRTLHRRSMTGPGDLTAYLSRLRPNQMLLTHLEFSQERANSIHSSGVRFVFLIRDPRDIVVSQAHFVAGRPQHAHYETFAAEPSLKERMRLVIQGHQSLGYPSLRSRLSSYMGWLDSESLVVRYEDIIGAAGGGDDKTQQVVLRRVFDHLHLPLDDAQLNQLATRTFSPSSPTFRRGTTQQWRQNFDEEIAALYKASVGDLASRYGYSVSETSA